MSRHIRFYASLSLALSSLYVMFVGVRVVMTDPDTGLMGLGVVGIGLVGMIYGAVSAENNV